MDAETKRRVATRKVLAAVALAPPVLALAGACSRQAPASPLGPGNLSASGADHGDHGDHSAPPAGAHDHNGQLEDHDRPPTTVARPAHDHDGQLEDHDRPPAPQPTTTRRPTPTTKPAADAGPKTVAGPVVQHVFGPVQVTVTVTGGRITKVTSTGPNDNDTSKAVNGMALPKLDAEVLAAQSADVAAVSGATYTSQAYRTSLQAALDQAMGGGGTTTPAPGGGAPTTAAPGPATPATTTPTAVSPAGDTAEDPASGGGVPAAGPAVPVTADPTFTG